VRLYLDQISADGTDVAVDLSAVWALRAANDGLGGEVSELSGTLSFSVQNSTLLIGGEIQAKCKRECDRCGGFLILEIEGPVDLAYRPEIQSSEAVRELSSAELDVGFYTDGVFEVADAVREHLALQLPFQVTCELPMAEPEEEGCTTSLFEETKEDEVDPRFAILKQLKFDN